MADDSTIKNVTTNPALEGLTSSSKTTEGDKTSAANRGAIDQHEFLMLLVNQLQNQDPLNPMNNEEFAVQLAQFSSLEQLVDINKKLTDGGLGGTSTVSSMASFLGHEVVLKDEFVQIAGGKGPNVMVNLPTDMESARVDLVDQSGQTVKSITLEDSTAGRKVVSLGTIDVGNGAYEVRAVGVNSQGQFVTLDSKVSGTVEGFVLEPEPALIVNGEPVTLEQIKEVYVAPKRA